MGERVLERAARCGVTADRAVRGTIGATRQRLSGSAQTARPGPGPARQDQRGGARTDYPPGAGGLLKD